MSARGDTVMEGDSMRERPGSPVYGAGVEGASSFNGGYTHSRAPTTPPRSTQTATDGFLGDVARWKDVEENGESRSTLGVRTSRMIGSKLGVSPPPPPGPPPSNPPPLPPPSFHPFASSTGTRPRRQSQQMPPGRQSTLNALRKPPTPVHRTVSPAGPPPTTSLPPLPNQQPVGGPAGSPTPAGPSFTGNLGSPIRTKQSPSSEQPPVPPPPPASSSTSRTARPPRTPSRHLLKTALDLAQKAVEMDRSNDVPGALAAYREAVSKLKDVMDRVELESRGDEKKKRGKTEEEGRTLKGIHDAYVARIQLLSSYEVGLVAEESDEVKEQPTARSSTNALLDQPAQSTGSSVTENFDRPKTSQTSSDSHARGKAQMWTSNDTSQTTMSSPRKISSPSRPKTPPPRSIDTIGPSPRSPNVNGGPSRDVTPAQAVNQAADTGGTPFPSRTSPLRPCPPKVPIPARPAQPASLPQAPNHRSLGLGHPSSSPSNLISSHMAHHVRNTSVASMDSAASLSPTSRKYKRLNRPSMGLDMEADLSGIDGVEVLATTPTEPAVSQLTGSAGRAQTPSPQMSVASDERPLPPLPASLTAPIGEGEQYERIRSASSSSHTSGAGRPSSGSYLVSPNTKQGTISQRRRSKPNLSGDFSFEGNEQQSPSAGLTQSSRRSSISSLTFGRARAKSQPGNRPNEDLPPIPTQRQHQPSYSISSQFSAGGSSPPHIQHPNPLLQQMPGFGRGHGLRISTATSGLSVPTINTTRSGNSSLGSPRSMPPLPNTAGGSYTASSSAHTMSPSPEPQPSEELLRPFHVLRILRQSMEEDSTGVYLTPGILITPALWNPSIWTKSTESFSSSTHPEKSNAPKIVAQDVKTRCMHTLGLCLESMRPAGNDLIGGPRDRDRDQQRLSEGEDPGWNSKGEEFIRALDELEEEMDSVGKMLGKGGVGVSGWRGWKTGTSTKSWGSRLTRGMDKISNNKSLDTPEKYVDTLAYLCGASQILADHLLNFIGPCTVAYASLSERTYREIEARIRRSSEYLRVLVVPFVLEDFKLFLLRYLKGGVRYLED